MSSKNVFNLVKRDDGMFVVSNGEQEIEMKFTGDPKFVTKFVLFARDCVGYTKADKGTKKKNLIVSDDLFEALVESAKQSKGFQLETRNQRLPSMSDEECIRNGINPVFKVEFGMAVPLNPRTFRWEWAYIRKASYENENHLEIATKLFEEERQKHIRQRRWDLENYYKRGK